MKRILGISFTAALFAAVACAQSSGSLAEERFRAKHGRYTPAKEAQIKAEQSNTAFREDKEARKQSRPSGWAETRHSVKFGRPSPAEEARIKAEQDSVAFREDTTAKEIQPAETPRMDTWYSDVHSKKFGRRPNTK